MTKRKLALLILIAFAATFLAARLIVRGIYAGWSIGGFLFVAGIHVHHFNLGILLLAFGGLGAHCLPLKKWFTAVVYGVGLGLVCDEWGMLILMADDYYNRLSYLAVATTLAILSGCLIETKGFG